MKVLAFDPGGSTGWAKFEKDDERNGFHFDGSTFVIDEHHAAIRELIEFERPDIVVYETFEFRQKAGSEEYRKGLELISREYIGVIKLTCRDYDIPMVAQSPSFKDVRIVADDNLTKLKVLRYPLYPNRHYHDAMKHLLYYLIQKRRTPELIEVIRAKH